MDSPFLSIIIPAYNAAEFIERTLQSCKNQTGSNFEVIIINDGSTDNSVSIIEELIKAHANFKLFNKENGGVSSARNFGISKSTGRYISFLDSDDTLEDYYVAYAEDIISNQQSIDVFIYGFEIIQAKRTKIIGPNTSELLKNYSPYDVIEQNPTACAKLFRTVLIKNKIEFYKSNTLEDVFFALETLAQKPIIYTAKQFPYKYLLNNVSLSQSIKKGIIDQREDIVTTYYNRLLMNGRKDEVSFITFFMARVLKQVFISCGKNMKKEDRFTSYKQSLQHVRNFNRTIKNDFGYKNNLAILKIISSNRIKLAYFLVQCSKFLPQRLSYTLFKFIS